MQNQNDTNNAQGAGSDQQQMYNNQQMMQQQMMGQNQMGNMMNPNMMQQMGYAGAQGANGQALPNQPGMMGMMNGMQGNYMGQPGMTGGQQLDGQGMDPNGQYPGQGGDMNNARGGNNNGEYNDEDSNENGAGKGKRRSKNDVEGRDFKCNYCTKTYLSYPALYTHIKQKHSKGPDGEARAPPTSGRGRGRPRKNPYHRTDPQKDAYFQQDEKKGGPTDPLLWFHTHFEQLLKDDDKYKSVEDYPLYENLKQFSASFKNGKSKDDGNLADKLKEDAEKADAKAEKEAKEKKEEADTPAEEQKEGSQEDKPADNDENWRDLGWKRDYYNLTEDEKLKMYVDEIFAFYLYDISKKVNDQFYKTVLAFVIFFRECLNEIGWRKRKENDTELKPEDFVELEKQPFCDVNSAEHAPEICNEFVTVYMEKHKGKIEIIKCEQIDLTINMCHWLFEKQFTCSKLTMIT